MKVIVDEDCTNKSFFESVLNQIECVLLNVLEPFALTTLKYFVIADSDAKNFYKVLKKYAKYLNTEIAYEDSEMYLVAGKSIEGFDDSGNYSQVIIIKSGLVVGMLTDLNNLYNQSKNELQEETNIQWIGLTTIIHELGHAIDNEIFFNLKHTVNLRCAYNLSNKDERKEFFENQTISLWGEFFAESFVYIVCPVLRDITKSKAGELLNCLDNYRGTEISPIDRAYRILYLFAHTIAQNEKACFDFSVFDTYDRYVQILKTVESELFRILEKYPKINIPNDFDIIKREFHNLCMFECRQ